MTKREEIERAEWIQLVLAVADNRAQLAQNLEHFHDIAYFRGRASAVLGPSGCQVEANC